MGWVALLAVLAASTAQAQPRKKGARGNKGRSSGSSMQRVDPFGSRSTSSEPTTSGPPVDSTLTPPPAPPTPAPEPATQPERDDAEASEADRPPRPDYLPILVLGVQPLWEGRVFRQSEFTEPTFRKYGAIGYPSVALAAEVYPLANAPSKFLRGFGLTFQYARAFGFQSDSTLIGDAAHPQPAPVDTSFSRYGGALRYRLPLNPESPTPFVLGASAGFHGWSYEFAELPIQADVQVPTAAYQMVRFGFDGTLHINRVTLYAALNYLHAFSIAAPRSRELDRLRAPHLPDAVGTGGEVRGAVGVRLMRWLEVRLSVQYGLLAYDLKSLDELDGRPARVLDSYLSAGLGPYVNF
jgi:hypothetical protein